MSLTQQRSEELFKQSEKGYLQFLQLLFQMQISCLQTMSFASTQISERIYAEKQIISSLTLIDKILMHLCSREIWMEKDYDSDSDIILDNEIVTIEHLILEFKLYFKKYSFISNSNKEHCKRLTEQLSGYFYKNRIKIIIVDPTLPKPWLNAYSPNSSIEVASSSAPKS